MSNNIDNRIVEMEFRNGSFEKGIAQTMSSLKNLDSALQLKNGTQGFDAISRAASQVSLDSISQSLEQIAQHFTAVGQIADVVLHRITNFAIDTGKKLVNAFLIGPAKQGLEEYGQELTSVQTLTNSTGASVAEVRKTLDVLNTYADKTIYSFGDMTSSLSKFTNAGIELPKAEKAIRGISNAAAHAGAGTQQASSAMYNFSQALSTGYMGLMDWRSISNTANIGTTSFKQTLLDMGVAMGTLVKTEEGYISTTTGANGKTAEAFELSKGWDASLNSQWMSTDVMTKALEVYGTDVRELTEDEKNKYEQGLKDLGLTDEQIKKYEELGIKAADSAQEVKTFSQMIDVTKEAIGSGWAQSWKLIFGDLDEAKKLFTGATNAIGEVISRISDWRNSMLKFWADNGGRAALIDTIAKAWQGLITVMDRFHSAWIHILGPLNAKVFVQISEGIKTFTTSLGRANSDVDNIEQIFGGLLIVVKMVGEAFLFVAKAVLPPLASIMSVVANSVIFLLGTLGRLVRWAYNIGYVILKPVVSAFGQITGGINDVVSAITGKLNNAIHSLTTIIAKFDVAHFANPKVLHEFIDPFIWGLTDLSKVFANTVSTVISGLKSIISWLGSIGKMIMPILLSIGNEIGRVITAIGQIIHSTFKAVQQVLEPSFKRIGNIINKITGYLGGILFYVKSLGRMAVSEIAGKFSGAFLNLHGILEPFAKTLKKVAVIFTNFALKVLDKVANGLTIVANWLERAWLKIRLFSNEVNFGNKSVFTPFVNTLNKARTAIVNFAKSLDISGKLKSLLTGLNAIKNAIAASFKFNINPEGLVKDIKNTFDKLAVYISTNGLFKGSLTEKFADLKEVGSLAIFGIGRAFKENMHLGSFFSDLGGMLKAAASEFATFIKANIPEKLLAVRDAFKRFAVDLWKSAQTNIPKAFTVIKNSITDIPGTIDKLKTAFNNWKTNAELPEWLQKIINKIKDFVAQRPTLQSMLDMLKKAGDAVKDFGKSIADSVTGKFQNLTNGFKSIVGHIKDFVDKLTNLKETVSNTIAGIVEKVKNFIANIDWNKAFNAAKFAGFAMIVFKIKEFVDSLTSVTDSVSAIPESLSGVIDTLGETISGIGDTMAEVGEAEGLKLKAEAFKAFANAILTVTGAIFLISQIPSEDLYRALVVVGLIAAIGVAIIKSLTAFTGARTAAVAAKAAAEEVAEGAVGVAQTLQGPLTILAKGLSRAMTFVGLGVFIVSIGVTFGLIVSAFKTLCENEDILKNAKPALGIMTVLVVELGVLATVLARMNGQWGGLTASTGVSMVLITFAISKMAKIAIMLGNTDWKVALRGLVWLAVLLGELGGVAVVMSIYGPEFAGMSASLRSMSNAILKLALVVAVLGNMKISTIAKGEAAILGLSAIIAGLAWVMSLISTKVGGMKQVNKMSQAIIKMAGAIAILGAVAGVLSLFNQGKLWSAVGAIAALTVVLGGLMTGLAFLTKIGPDVAVMVGVLAGSMLLLAGAIAIMAASTVALALLGDRLWPAIGAIAALAAILVIFLGITAGIAYVLGPGILAITALTRAFAMLFLGLAAFLAGLSIFIITITAFGEQFVDAIMAIGQKINGRKQEFIQAIANLIEGVVGGIALGIAGAYDEILIALEQVAVSIAQHLPEIFYHIMVAIIMCIVRVVQSIYDTLGKVFPGIWDKIRNGANKIRQNISNGWHKFVSTLEGFLANIINWLAEKLKDIPVLGDALQKLGDKLSTEAEANAKKIAESASKGYEEETARQTPRAKAASSHQVQEVASTVETEGEAVTQASAQTATDSSDAFASNFNLNEIVGGNVSNASSTLSQYSQYMPAEMAAMGQNGSNAFGMNFDLSSIAGTEMGDMTSMLEGGSVDVESIMSQMGTSGAEAATNTEAYANAGTQNVSEFVASAVTEGNMSAADLTSALQELGYAVPEGFSEGIVAKKDEGSTAISTAMTEAIESGRLALDSHSPSLVFDQMGQDSMAGYAQGVQTGAEGAGTALTTAFTGMVESIKASLPQFEVGATGIMDSIKKSIETGTPGVNTSMMQVLSTLLTSIRQKSRDFYTRGVELVRNFEQGMSSRAGYARSAASGVASSALGGFGSYQNSAYQVGVYMAEGFKNGIMSKTSEIAAAAAAAARAAITSAQAASQEKSPSKAFFRIGAYDGEGLILGIRSTQDDVYDEGWDLGYAALVGTMSMMDKVSEYLEENPDFQPTITPVLDLTDLSAGAERIRNLIGDILLPTDSIAASMDYRHQENQALADMIGRQNTLLGDILTKLNQGNLLDPNRIYEAIRIGASDSHPSIVANNREVTRYFKEIGVAFSG